MRKANKIKVETPKLEGTAFYILGGKNVPSDIPYSKARATSSTMTMMDIAYLQQGDEGDAERLRVAIEELVNDTIRSMSEQLVEVFGEGTFLVKDQSGKEQTTTNGSGLININTDGYRISITMSKSGYGLEVVVETDVYAPGRHGKVKEIHVAGQNLSITEE